MEGSGDSIEHHPMMDDLGSNLPVANFIWCLGLRILDLSSPQSPKPQTPEPQTQNNMKTHIAPVDKAPSVQRAGNPQGLPEPQKYVK